MRFDEFIQKVGSVDFEDFSTFRASKIEGDESQLAVECHIQIEEEPDFHEVWSIECSGIVKQSLELGQFDRVYLSTDHILLGEYSDTKQRLGFRGNIGDPHSVVGKLYERHQGLAGDWIPFTEYMLGREIMSLITCGFGTLAEGPTAFIEVYDEVLQSYGIGTTVTGIHKNQYWNGKTFSDYPQLLVLFFNEAFVIAEKFEARPI